MNLTRFFGLLLYGTGISLGCQIDPSHTSAFTIGSALVLGIGAMLLSRPEARLK